MPLLTTSHMKLQRNQVVKYRTAKGTVNAIIKAITGATLTLWLPHNRMTVTTAAKATTDKSTGWHHRK